MDEYIGYNLIKRMKIVKIELIESLKNQTE